VKAFTESCNTAKRDLDLIKEKLDIKTDEKRLTMREDMAAFEDEGDGDHQGAHDIIDEEELGLLQKMKELKKIYKQNYNGLKDTKLQVHYVQQTIDTLKQNLVSAYEDWYGQTFLVEDELLTSSIVSVFRA
jgi:kinesin family protein 6/9